MFVQILLITCCLPFVIGDVAYYWTKFKDEYINGYELSTRLLNIIWSYYEDASERIVDSNHMRFMYEESPHYEMGYVIHEVIERYKKMVEVMQNAEKYKTKTVYDCLDLCEMSQKLYFEIYHLVNMIHEIPRKWKHLVEFNVKIPVNMTDYLDAMKSMATLAREKRKRDKELQKLLKKKREMLEKGLLTLTERPASAKRDPYNIHWPIDYGWEIDSW